MSRVERDLQADTVLVLQNYFKIYSLMSEVQFDILQKMLEAHFKKNQTNYHLIDPRQQ